MYLLYNNTPDIVLAVKADITEAQQHRCGSRTTGTKVRRHAKRKQHLVTFLLDTGSLGKDPYRRLTIWIGFGEWKP